MFDAYLRRLIDPPLDAAARRFVTAGIGADTITIVGTGFGIVAALTIANGCPLAGLALFVCGRLLDGLDGAVARRTMATARGGFLDITLDFVVYAAVPVAFAWLDAPRNALAASALLAAFLINGSAFLAFATIAEKLGIATEAQGAKSIYYLSGLAEGAETIVFFAAFCIWPDLFEPLALVFAALCAVSGVARIVGGARLLKPPPTTRDRDQR